MLPPINVWAVCLVGGILPQEPARLVFENGMGYLSGINGGRLHLDFSLFSLNKRRLFYANINQLKDVFVKSILWLEQYFINHVPRDVFLQKNRELLSEIVKIVTVNETLLESMSQAPIRVP